MTDWPRSSASSRPGFSGSAFCWLSGPTLLADNSAHDEVGPGLVSFARASGGRIAHFRTYRSLIAAAAPVVSAAKLRPGDRVLTLLPPDDLKGLATGLVAGLIAGATVEAHALFDSSHFLDALARPEPTHIVLPGWMEPALAEIAFDPGLRSIILVHEPPLRFEDRPGLAARIVDVVCCSEFALLSCARGRPDQISFDALCAAAAEGLDPPLLEVRLDLTDEICLRGPAVALPDRAADSLDWQRSGLKIERNGSALTGIA